MSVSLCKDVDRSVRRHVDAGIAASVQCGTVTGAIQFNRGPSGSRSEQERRIAVWTIRHIPDWYHHERKSR